MAQSTCPVYSPTIDEFREFRKYIENLSKSEASNVGICKIIPPVGWFRRDYDIPSIPIEIPSPVRQCVSGRAGVYEVQLLELEKMTVEQFSIYANRNIYGEPNMEERERKFWKTLGSTGIWEEPIYGADVMGTLFGDDDASGWNLDNLDSILKDIGSIIPGVNCGYLYFGMWRSMFAYHTEDYDLFSVNYLHYGEPKSWYAIPPSNRNLFESMAGSYFRKDSLDCKEYLRHKTKLFSPNKLKEHGISFHTVVQHAGELVITFPGSYHAGFNHGFNIAEATNFATSSWFDIGRKAKHCVCRPNAVILDIDRLEAAYLRKINALFKDESSGSMAPPIMRMRCQCGEKSLLQMCSSSVVGCCSSCRLHFHRRCVDNRFATRDICHICASITEADSADVPPDDNDEVDEAFISSLRVGSTVSALVQGCYVEGSIVDIEDSYGRFHIKGRKRDADIWLPLLNFGDSKLAAQSMQHIQPHESPSSPSATPVTSSSKKLPKKRKQVDYAEEHIERLREMNSNSSSSSSSASFLSSSSELDSSLSKQTVSHDLSEGTCSQSIQEFDKLERKLVDMLNIQRVSLSLHNYNAKSHHTFQSKSLEPLDRLKLWTTVQQLVKLLQKEEESCSICESKSYKQIVDLIRLSIAQARPLNEIVSFFQRVAESICNNRPIMNSCSVAELLYCLLKLVSLVISSCPACATNFR